MSAVRQADRIAAIVERLSGDGAIGVADLAGELHVSAATIRRDLQLLEDQRMLRRTHGGAVAEGVLYELPLRYKAARRQEEKGRISAAAAARVSDGMVVGFTGGTTTTEVARSLFDRRGLTIVTNALNIAGELAIRADIKMVVTGGTARPESYELVGPLAERSLEDLNVDIAFVGVDGIDADAGLTTHHEIEAHTNRALLDRAHRVIVVTDSTKVGRVAFARICPIGQAHELITDDGAPTLSLRAITDAGVAVEVV